MKLNLSQAAKAAKVSRSTLYRHISKGKVSVEIDQNGERCIDLSELYRCYGDVVQSWDTNNATPNVPIGHVETPRRTPPTDQLIDLATKVARLEAENEALRAQDRTTQDALQQRISELEADKRRLFDLVERQSLLLTEGDKIRPSPPRKGARSRLKRWWLGDDSDHEYKRQK